MYKGIDWDNRRQFLLDLAELDSSRIEKIKTYCPKGWTFTKIYYGLGEEEYQNQNRIAEKFGVKPPSISAKIAAIICYLGCSGHWSQTTQENALSLSRRIAKETDSSENEALIQKNPRQTKSERIRREFGWSDSCDVSDDDVVLTRRLYTLLEEGALDVLRGIHIRSYKVLQLRHGLDVAGYFRTFAEVADLLNIAMSVAQSDYQRALRILYSPRFKQASERIKKQA